MIGSKSVWELCPNCENEVALYPKLIMQVCPICYEKIKPCAMCDMDNVDCIQCPLDNGGDE